MKEKELDQLEEKEAYDVKYMSELREYWNAYSYALINEIYTGVAINLGMSPKDAYKLARSRPGTMEKAGFFSSVFDKFKSMFKHKVPKFRYKPRMYGSGKPMTQKQWDKFNQAVDKYWNVNASKVSEDVGIKSFLLGRNTTEFREKKKPYSNKSLFQVAEDQYNGNMPENISQAYKDYDFTNAEKQSMNRANSSISMYVTRTNNDIKDAIRQQIQSGIDNEKSPIEVASDLYWNVEKDENMVNKYTAESLRRDWNRVSSTEMAMAYEAAILAPYESDAMESMKDPSKAKYFVRQGGTCEWCLSLRGSIVRLVPASIADRGTESLKDIGIEDPNTDTYIYVGKNNVGRKKKDWFNCCPGHPYNVATFAPIDLEKEEYNQKTDSVEGRQKKDSAILQQKDYHEIIKEEKEERKPKDIGGGKVAMNNNTYIAVSPEEYNSELEKWKKDSSRPIPVNTNSPSYKRIFGEAE